MFGIDAVNIGNPFVTARCGIDIVFIALGQVVWECRNKFHDPWFDSFGGSPVQPLHIIRFHI